MKNHFTRAPFLTKSRPQTHFRMNDMTNWPKLPSSSGSSQYWTNNHVKNASIPVWQNQNPSQNQWFKSGPPILSGQSSHPNLVKASGNASPTWFNPQPREENTIWGCNQLQNKMQIAMEIVKLMSQM